MRQWRELSGRTPPTLGALVVVLLAVTLAAPASAQFNPFGRRKPTPGFKPGGRQPPRPRPRLKPTRPKGPSTEALIARYRGIVLRQPGSRFPLQRLVELHRKRDGNLDTLVADFEKRAAAGGYNELVALAGIYRESGDKAKAQATLRTAVKKAPKNPIGLQALAAMLADDGDTSGARKYYEQALPHIKVGTAKELVLRTLLKLALDAKDYEDARKIHRRLVRRAKGSFYVEAELGRELMLRREYTRAEKELERLVRVATGDNRVLAPALRDLGRAQARLGKTKLALKTLKRALRVAGSQAGIRREILSIVVEVYRKEEKLRELIGILEKERGKGFERLRLLGSLYEETGQVDKALATYRLALRRKNDIETRLKVVQLLQIQGELGAVINEYRALIKAAPRNPDYVFQLVEALIQRGQRKQAMAELTRLERRSRGDEQTQAALVDFYERLGEGDRARRVLLELSRTGSDPRHLVDLGNRYWEEGKKKKAVAAWKRVLRLVRNRALAHYTVGQVYLEHDMTKEALGELKKAMKLAPKLVKYRKGYALALERTGASASSKGARQRQYDEAEKIWQELLAGAGDNQYQAREARRHIVTLWSLSGQLEAKLPPLRRRLAGKPPELEAGRLLAEAQIRLRKYSAAETTLRTVTKAAPGDVASLTRLERVLVLQRKLAEAIAVLKKLVVAEPKRAREYYQRMARYSSELYRDDDAIRFATKAVELSPDDAAGLRKLGEMYQRRGDTKRAIRYYRKAISKNDRMWLVYLQLADLLERQEKFAEADRLLRRVVRAAPDEELVKRAAQKQMGHGTETLKQLEQDLLPLSLGNPTKPIYRRLLVEVYGRMVHPLIVRLESDDPATVTRTRGELRRIGERAVKPLLDALIDDREEQQTIAIQLLSHIQNKSAGPALFTFATGGADSRLRTRAMLAVGMLGDEAMLKRLGGLLVERGETQANESDPVSVAAAWSVAAIGTRKARPLLLRLLKSDAPSVRTLAALGLADPAPGNDAKAIAELRRVVRSEEVGPLPRAAAAFALGALSRGGRRSAAVEADLAVLADSPDRTARAHAILALARLRSPTAARSIAAALVSTAPQLRASARAAARVLGNPNFQLPEAPLGSPSGRPDVRALLDALRPGEGTPDDDARALLAVAAPLPGAATAAVQSAPESASVVADALLARGGAPAFGRLTSRLEEAQPALRKQAEALARKVEAATTRAFVALAAHPAPEVRTVALRMVARSSSKEAVTAVLDALKDPDPEVRRAALTAVADRRLASAAPAVARLATKETSWQLRVHAATTLGRLSGPVARRALTAAATKDDYALVREAALKALAQLDGAAARPVLEAAARNEPEPRVRATARQLLKKP